MSCTIAGLLQRSDLLLKGNPLTKRPNFVFFITDQHRADWLGCYGHPVVKTPNIDAIASVGTRYEKFYVASPVCMPNRASLLTGRYPSLHGLRYNGCTLSQDANTFVDVLAAGGYHTAAIGKSHLQPFTDQAPKNPVKLQTGPIREAWKSDTRNYAQEEPGRYDSDDQYLFETPYYGYQHVDMVTTHGDRCGGHYQQWFREKAPNWRDLHDDANQLPHNYSCPQAYRTPIPEELYPSAYIRDKAVEYIDNRPLDDQPFFLFVSFPDPHHPFNPPGKYWDMYSPDDFELTLPYAAHRNPTPPMQYLKANWEKGVGQATPQTAMMIDEQQLKEAMALTAGMITMVDDAIGEVMTSLKQSGHHDNTVVCFNADHGDYLGDFNMLLKGALPFESITRVPFIWSDPASRVAKVDEQLASTVDISCSVLNRAGLGPYHGIQGQVIAPNSQEANPKRDELLIEYNDGIARLGFDEPARVRSLVSQNFRFTIYRDEEWGELYDLQKDPNETQNLWNDPNYLEVKTDLSLRLNSLLIAQMDESPRAKRIA